LSVSCDTVIRKPYRPSQEGLSAISSPNWRRLNTSLH
jgi:hypothetical protein